MCWGSPYYINVQNKCRNITDEAWCWKGNAAQPEVLIYLNTVTHVTKPSWSQAWQWQLPLHENTCFCLSWVTCFLAVTLRCLNNPRCLLNLIRQTAFTIKRRAVSITAILIIPVTLHLGEQRRLPAGSSDTGSG